MGGASLGEPVSLFDTHGHFLSLTVICPMPIVEPNPGGALTTPPASLRHRDIEKSQRAGRFQQVEWLNANATTD